MIIKYIQNYIENENSIKKIELNQTKKNISKLHE